MQSGLCKKNITINGSKQKVRLFTAKQCRLDIQLLVYPGFSEWPNDQNSEGGHNYE
jgi:hypothetical protein